MPEGFKQRVEGNNNVQVNGDLVVNISEENSSDTSAIEHVIRTGYVMLILSIAAASLPHPIINMAASISTASIGALICVLSLSSRRIGSTPGTRHNKLKSTVAAMILLSMTTGCAGPMLARVPDPALKELVKNHKAGVDQGVGVFGFGLDDITIQSAAQNGGIEEVYFADQIRGYGLISYRKVSVFGE